MIKIIRTSTIPLSLNIFYKGFFQELEREGYEVVAVSSPGSDLDEIQAREGIRTIAVPMERSISPLKDIRSLYKLVKTIKKEKPLLIHSITPKAGLLTMAAGWLCRVPIRLHTFTGLVFPSATGLKKQILKLTDRLTCAFATHITPEGEGVKRDLINNCITRKPLEVLGFGNIKGIDSSYFDPNLESVRKRAEEIVEEGVFTFIFIGRIASEKGVGEMVRSFKKIHDIYPATRLILIGWNEADTPELKKLIETGDTGRNGIKYAGYQKDIRPWLAASDVLILPSYREGFPNSVIEGGAMGLPSIVTDINGANEIITHEVNGLIIPPRNENALFKAMLSLITDDKLRKTLSDNARPMIISRFEQKFVRDCLKSQYKNLLNDISRN